MVAVSMESADVVPNQTSSDSGPRTRYGVQLSSQRDSVACVQQGECRMQPYSSRGRCQRAIARPSWRLP
jgi:hypothetical protein